MTSSYGNVAGHRLLDLGCGHGWLAEQLCLAGAMVTGIDGSEALLRHASTAYPEVTFAAHDLTTGTMNADGSPRSAATTTTTARCPGTSIY